MRKLFLVTALLFIAGSLAAQDLPPLPGGDSSGGGLPPLPGDNSAPATSTGLPPLPGGDNASAGGLPPLPGGDNSAPGGAPAGLPALPGADNSAAGGLPPLPGESAAPAPAGGGLPPLPGESAPAPGGAPAGLPALPGTEQAPPAAPAATSPVPVQKPSGPNLNYISKHQPNVIYGGWVTPKGGGAQIRIAWTSQEILNALDKRGYEVVNEHGDYVENKWRQFTFSVPKSDLSLEVYLHQIGNKIWVRVGPSEAPAGVPLVKVERMKQESFKALQALRTKFKNRLAPAHRGKWESPFNRIKQTADA